MVNKQDPDYFAPGDVAPHAYQWSLDELEEMAAIIAGLLEARESDNLSEHEQGTMTSIRRGRRGGGGYYEDKMINGRGPYRYLRYMRGGSRKSVYVGKVD